MRYVTCYGNKDLKLSCFETHDAAAVEQRFKEVFPDYYNALEPFWQTEQVQQCVTNVN
jgi:hypothetical protein